MTDEPESIGHEDDSRDESPEPPGEEVGPTGKSAAPPPHNRRRDWLDYITLLLAAVAAFIYGWQAHSLSQEVAGTNKALDLMKNDQRAWVGVERIDGASNDALDLSATVYTKNFGKTPALGFGQRLNNRLLPSKEEFTPDYGGASTGSVGVLLPGTEQIGNFPSHTWKPEEVAALKEEKSILYRYGEITYRDVFGRDHWTTFCDRLVYRDSKPIGWAWEVNDTYNDTDDEHHKRD